MRFIAIIPALMLLSACEHFGLDKKEETAAFAPPERTLRGGLEIGSASAFKGKQVVVLAGFSVGFVESKDVTYATKTGLLGEGKKKPSQAHLKLEQVDDGLKQQIVDAAYVNFIERLKAAGYVVADRNKLLRDADFIRVTGKNSPQRRELAMNGKAANVTFVSPTSIGKVYDTNASGFDNPITAAIDFAARKGTPVLFVEYLIDFAHAAPGGEWWEADAPVNVLQSISLVEGGGVSLIGGHANGKVKSNGYVRLAEPVSTTDSYASVVDLSRGKQDGIEDAVDYVSTVLSGNKAESRAFELEAKPERYGTLASELLAKANYKLIVQMAALR